ncbi:MAG: bifunctional sulfate adenylyltransferase/adenylylsulfate kinase [Gammaproteobacteria bacterium]|nr:bifunctional sulfate adenylyltransferase/adenylylsulfate kinase [Gammaproteobacteria bacterium]
MSQRIQYHGGALPLQSMADAQEAESLKTLAGRLPSLTLSQRQLCDLEMLMTGAYAPLSGFMVSRTYDSVVENLALPDGTLWTMPIILDVSHAFAEKLKIGEQVALRDAEGFMLAILDIEDIWQPDKSREAEKVYATDDPSHPGVQYLFDCVGPVYVGGRVRGVEVPAHYDFMGLWETPASLRDTFTRLGWSRVVAFQTNKVIHRLQRQIAVDVARSLQANLLLHPAVGSRLPGDLQIYARVHCYKAVRRYFPEGLMRLSLLPLASRMAGPREALWHAIVHQNYGCTDFIVGPKHANPTVQDGRASYYDADAARALIDAHSDKLEIGIVHVESHGYVADAHAFMPVREAAAQGHEALQYTDVQMKRDLAEGRQPPEWFAYPEVVEELRRAYPTRARQGLTLFFTGLSGAGKSTLAKIIYGKLVEGGRRPVTLLDGDVVRMNLSSELGFSRAHRDLNIKRIGFVASEITKNGGIAICAPIAPYRQTRRAVRELIEEHGGFVEIHVATPLDECEARDRKGLYAKARQGLIPEFTGISDPYETPEQAELVIDTTNMSPMESAQTVYLYLLKEGYIEA